MVHHAAQVICACMVGADGLTPFRRVKGASSAHCWRVSVNACGSGTLFWKEQTSSIRDAQRRGCLDSAFRMVRTLKRADADDRWKVLSPRDPFSAADLESTPAEFTCSRGTRGDVNPAAQCLERHPVDALPPDPDHEPVPRRQNLKQREFMAHGTSDRCPGCRASVSGGRAQATPRNVE